MLCLFLGYPPPPPSAAVLYAWPPTLGGYVYDVCHSIRNPPSCLHIALLCKRIYTISLLLIFRADVLCDMCMPPKLSTHCRLRISSPVYLLFSHLHLVCESSHHSPLMTYSCHASASQSLSYRKLVTREARSDSRSDLARWTPTLRSVLPYAMHMGVIPIPWPNIHSPIKPFRRLCTYILLLGSWEFEAMRYIQILHYSLLYRDALNSALQVW